MTPAMVTAVVAVLQLVGGLLLVPIVRREVSSLKASMTLIGADVGKLRNAVAELRGSVGEVDAMVANTRHGVELLVRESLDRRTEWEKALQ